MEDDRIKRRIRYLREGITANFTIKCRDRVWKVNRGILCAESDYFERLCIGAFKEAAEGTANFDDIEPEVIDQLLLYLYTGIYDDLEPLNSAIADYSTAKEVDSVDPSTIVSPPESTADGKDSSMELSAIGDTLKELDLDTVLWNCENKCAGFEKFDEATKTQITKVLTTAIGVYDCAHMMDLSRLVHLAVARFFKRERYFIRADLSLVLKTLFKLTSPDDIAMRAKMIERCIENRSLIESDIDIGFVTALTVIQEHEPMSWLIGDTYAKKSRSANGDEHTVEGTMERRAPAEKVLGGPNQGI